jgi:hypothetical protein
LIDELMAAISLPAVTKPEAWNTGQEKSAASLLAAGTPTAVTQN